MSTPRSSRQRHRRGGFTLIELLVSMVLGVVVIAISANFAASTLRSSRAIDLRDGLNRDARFVGHSISRDLQDAGVALESSQTFGSVAARGDTVMALSVPFLPNAAETYSMVVPASLADPLPPGGTCGATCIDLVNPGTVPFQLRVGDLCLLQVDNVRRLILISAVSTPSSTVRRITWTTADSLFVYPAGLTGGLLLRRTATAVRRLDMSAWSWSAAQGTMLRADGFTLTGQLRATVAARGVQSFTTRLLFMDGVERIRANGFDADTLNDYDRIVSVLVRSRIRIERTDRAINGGAVLFRDYQWRVTPRNLVFERNRKL